jgi:hypothetical protein
MKTGRIVSLEHGPKRDVEVRISKTELFSAISDPPGTISGSDVAGYEIAEDRSADAYSFRLYVRLIGGLRVLFYCGAVQFDLALLLDELEAALPHVPRSRTKA